MIDIWEAYETDLFKEIKRVEKYLDELEPESPEYYEWLFYLEQLHERYELAL